MNLSELKEPFKPEEIEWRIQQSGVKNNKPWGMCLAYVQNRAIMDRLDDVCGPENWMNIFRKAPDSGILCGISIKCGSEWIIKWDGASNTDIEAVKGGLSNAMKRAAVQWGIGRYLYGLDTGWAVFNKSGKYSAKMKDGTYHKWNPPQLPDWALPAKQKELKAKATEPKEQPIKVPSFLERMKGYAENESDLYWEILGINGFGKATDVPIEQQDEILSELSKKLTNFKI